MARQSDWLVERNGSVHTVDAHLFENTYKKVGLFTYVNSAIVWPVPAAEAGIFCVFEGATHYRQGVFIVWNDEAGLDGYAVVKEMFRPL